MIKLITGAEINMDNVGRDLVFMAQTATSEQLHAMAHYLLAQFAGREEYQYTFVSKDGKKKKVVLARCPAEAKEKIYKNPSFKNYTLVM